MVQADRYRRPAPDHHPTVVVKADLAPEQPASVTVVYRPNPSTLAAKESLAKRVTQTLAKIKEQSISFSDIRSAKEGLIKQVFSKKEPAPPPRQ